MRHLIGCMMLGVVACGIGARPREGPNTSSQVFLLRDSSTQQWCRFDKEADWKGQVQARSATTVASAEYAKGALSRIHVTEESESGDWTVYDDYFIDGGKLTRLLRKMNILPGDVSVEQVFRFTDRRAVIQKTTTRDLKSGNVVKAGDIDLPDVPVVTDLQKFPFLSLLAGRPDSPQSKETCIPESH